MKIGAGSIRGALIMAFINRYTVLVVNFGAIMVLARLLTPAETGLFSVAASDALLAQAVRDFGDQRIPGPGERSDAGKNPDRFRF